MHRAPCCGDWTTLGFQERELERLPRCLTWHVVAWSWSPRWCLVWLRAGQLMPTWGRLIWRAQGLELITRENFVM